MLAWLTPPIYPGSQRAGEDPLGEPQVSPGSNRQADRQKVGDIKLVIAVGKGKKKYDKRETIKKRDIERGRDA